ncbi:MAG: sigma-54-dependent Fis family transcriptional regulator [Bacteroidota bacterium]|nr:sigma-54-dependent Fis family transcriptional regulator [Bacteroidota bacterium]
MKEIIHVIQQVAQTDITVLVTGESGVGKEVVAQAIHATSRRSKKPMVTVNCGAIPEGIIESELFGHEKGSFTGASETRKGYFEIADGGTIFLDEIGELPLGVQVKFLRVLENGEFNRVGSSAARSVDVRVIAATNKDLEHEVRTKNFRPDLFFRLRSVNIRIPPLRDRHEDVPLFVEKFAKEFSEKNGISFLGFTPDAMEVLQDYYWPGNVRELRNVMESMLVIENGKKLSGDDVRKYLKGYQAPEGERNLPVYVAQQNEFSERELIYRALVDLKSDVLHLKEMIVNAVRSTEEIRTQTSNLQSAVGGFPHSFNNDNGEDISLKEMERRWIIGMVQKYGNNRRAAAHALQISERTLYRKLKEYGEV